MFADIRRHETPNRKSSNRIVRELSVGDRVKKSTVAKVSKLPQALRFDDSLISRTK
jgi:hypothetical protein